MALNSVTLSGRLVEDPTTAQVGKDSLTVCHFTIANDKRGKDAGTNFIDCTAWKGLGETIAKFFKKGSLIIITGRINQESWKDKDGNNRSKLGVIVDDFCFSGNKSESKTPSEEVGLFEEPAKAEKEEIDLSEIPF